MSDKLYQCKNCGARVLLTAVPETEHVSCPKCHAQNWVEIRGYARTRNPENRAWIQDFVMKLQQPGTDLYWK